MQSYKLTYLSYLYHTHRLTLFVPLMLLSWLFLQLTKNHLASEHLLSVPIISGIHYYYYMLKKHAQLKFLNED
ncbi:hypothetical protein LDENG_00066750 [Lucifuga dentata]|nr:hypothetical protein LDENG_00066750 [Lucifuga dentata]